MGETLREALASLAEDFESEVDWSSGRNNYGDNEAWESAARRLRALLAEHPATPAEEPAEVAVEEREAVKYAIDSGWLVEVVDEHTCGTAKGGYYGAHEPGCGLIPVANIADALRDHDAALTAKAKAEALREAADEWPWHDAGETWLRERADRERA